MLDNAVLDTLTKNNKIIDNVSRRLDSLKVLFDDTPIEIITPKEDGFILSNTIEAHTIFQDGDISVTHGIWHKIGDIWPDHSHKDSKEYLIVSKGKFLLRIEDISRMMAKGECASIKPGIRHSVTSLERDSQMFGVCVPPESAYWVEDLKCLKFPEKS